MANTGRVTQTGLLTVAVLDNAARVTQTGLLIVGSPPIYSLSAATGTYAESGNSGAITHNVQLAGASGNYTATGNAAMLTHSTAHAQILVAGSGSYTTVGSAALVNRPLITLHGVTGTYSEYGSSATIGVPPGLKSLVAATGTYSQAGSAATLTGVFGSGLLVSATSRIKLTPTISSAGSIHLRSAGSSIVFQFDRATCVPQQTYFYPVAKNLFRISGTAVASVARLLSPSALSRLILAPGSSALKNAVAAASSRVILKPGSQTTRDIHVAATTTLNLSSSPGEDLGVAYRNSTSKIILKASCALPTVASFGVTSKLILVSWASSQVACSEELLVPGTNQSQGLFEVLMSGLNNEGFPFSLAETGNGVLLLANGIDPMIRWDGLTQNAQFAGVAAPPTALVMTGSGNGFIQGRRWAYLRWVDQFGNFSNLSPIFGPVNMGESAWIDQIVINSSGVPVCTSRSHGLTSGTVVTISGVDELPISGQFSVAVSDQNTFQLNGIICSAGTQTSKPATWTQGAAQVNYSNVPVPTDLKITRRQILRNLDGNAQVFYVDIDTTDVTSTSFWSSRLDDSLSAQAPVPLAFEDDIPEAARYDLPPSHKSVLEYHLGRVFATVDRPYVTGNVVVSHGSYVVQGIGTNWLPTFVGRAFYVAGAQQFYHVDQVVNGQFLVLDQPYSGPSNKFAAYCIRPSDTESRLVYYSDPNRPESWPSWNAFAVPDHGDEITGLLVMKSYLFIIEKRHISSFTFKSVPGRDGFIFLKSHRGCINNRCVVLVEDAAFMLDEAGVHRFDGETSTHLSAKINNIFNDPTYPYQLDWASPNIMYWHGVQDPIEENIRWFVDFKGKERLTHALCYDYRRDRWWLEQYPEAITSSCLATLGYRRVLAGTTSRRVVVLGEGVNDGIAVDVYGAMRGTVATATSTTITVDPTQPVIPINLAGVPVAITTGVAKGTIGIISANLDQNTIELWEELDIIPEPGDQVLIGAVPWTWRNGWLPFWDDESDYSRDLSAIFKPTSSGASFDMKLYYDYNDDPRTWTVSRSTDGVTTIQGSPDINVSTDKSRGYAFQRMQFRREIYGQGDYFVSLQLSGSQGLEATRIFEIIMNGCYSQARKQ